MGIRGQRHAPVVLPLESGLVSVVQEAQWAKGPVWMGAENLAPPTGSEPRTVQAVASCYTDRHEIIRVSASRKSQLRCLQDSAVGL